MAQTDVIINSDSRKFMKDRGFKATMHDLQYFAEKFGLDFVLFIENEEKKGEINDNE